MTAYHRIKHTFTAGELSPLLESRADFERYKNGCRRLRNMTCMTQGPAMRRSGFHFVYDLNKLGLDTADPQLRMIPFVFNEIQSYALIFFKHLDGEPRMVIATTSEQDGDGLVIVDGSDPPVVAVLGGFPEGWDNLVFDWAQSADEMYIAQPNLKPHIIQRYDDDDWRLAVPDDALYPTDWSDELGWPEKVTFHQQRLAYAASLTKPQTLWLSRSGDFGDFTYDSGTPGGIPDDHAIIFTLDSGQQNKIQWILSAKALNVGTLGNEWTVTGSTQFALTPSNVLAQRQTNNGSEPNKPIMVGITTLFIERHGRTVNEFVYDYTFDSYKTSDMAILSPHVTERYSITDWTYQQTPDSVIWCVREDGALLGITYQRHHQVIGWHIHETKGQFRVLTCVPGITREDNLWTVIKRVINGEDKYYVEKMTDQFKDDDNAKNGRFLDSYLDRDGDPVDTLSNLEHLEGETIDILADGTVHPSQVVVDGGCELNNDYSNIVVGLPYVSEVRPYLMDIPAQNGTVIGRMQRVVKVDIDFYRTLGIYIGRDDQEDGESEEEHPFRIPAHLMGQAVPIYSGIYHMDFPEGFDRKVEYFIRQYQPLPCIVRGVVDTVEVEE